MKKKTLTILLIIALVLSVYPIINYFNVVIYHIKLLVEYRNNISAIAYNNLIEVTISSGVILASFIFFVVLFVLLLVNAYKGNLLYQVDEIKEQLKINKEKRKEKKKQKLERKLKDLEDSINNG